MTVVDASIVVRFLLNRRADAALRERFAQERLVHAPALIDAEVSSAVRGLSLSAKPQVTLSEERAAEMFDDYANLQLVRHPMQPVQRRVHALRHNMTAYDGFYVALAESLRMTLLVDDRKFAATSAHHARIETWD